MQQGAEKPDEPECEKASMNDDVGRAHDEGPDPVIGAGMVLFSIFVMGLGGSRGWHFVFNAGTLVAIIGAAVFVLIVALSAVKQGSSDHTNRQGT